MNTVTKGLLLRLAAKPGQEQALEDFLVSALPRAQAEEGTTAWFAIKLGPAEFGIFDAFPDDKGRDAHMTGLIAQELIARMGELLAMPPKVSKVDVLAAKLPA